jgi:putative transposase
MPRTSRYLKEGYTFHLTHSCHDRRFLLKFARDRNIYGEWLRVALNDIGFLCTGNPGVLMGRQ